MLLVLIASCLFFALIMRSVGAIHSLQYMQKWLWRSISLVALMMVRDVPVMWVCVLSWFLPLAWGLERLLLVFFTLVLFAQDPTNAGLLLLAAYALTGLHYGGKHASYTHMMRSRSLLAMAILAGAVSFLSYQKHTFALDALLKAPWLQGVFASAALIWSGLSPTPALLSCSQKVFWRHSLLYWLVPAAFLVSACAFCPKYALTLFLLVGGVLLCGAVMMILRASHDTSEHLLTLFWTWWIYSFTLVGVKGWSPMLACSLGMLILIRFIPQKHRYVLSWLVMVGVSPTHPLWFTVGAWRFLGMPQKALFLGNVMVSVMLFSFACKDHSFRLKPIVYQIQNSLIIFYSMVMMFYFLYLSFRMMAWIP